MTAGDSPKVDRVLDTYRYVRVIAVVPAVWLLLSIVGVWIFQHRVLDSISDYYGGPLRDVFVGALMACGICLIAYKGETQVEDYVLNFAGFNTFFVALVPNSFATELAATRAAEKAKQPVAETSEHLLQNLGIALIIFLLVAAVFIVIDSQLFKWGRFQWRKQGRPAKVFVVISWTGEIVLMGIIATVAMMSFVGNDWTWGFTAVHFGAASLMILNFTFAASSHAFPTALRTEKELQGEQATNKVLTGFRAIAMAMALGLAYAFLNIWAEIPYWVITVECVEILLFIVFWILATREEWRKVRIPAKLMNLLPNRLRDI